MNHPFPTDVDWRRITRRIAFHYGCQEAAASAVGMSVTAFRRYSAGKSARPKYSGAARILNFFGEMMPDQYRGFTGCDYIPLPEVVDWQLLIAIIHGTKKGDEFALLFDDETWSAYRAIGNERASVIYDPIWRNAALVMNYLAQVDGGVDWLDSLRAARRAA